MLPNTSTVSALDDYIASACTAERAEQSHDSKTLESDDVPNVDVTPGWALYDNVTLKSEWDTLMGDMEIHKSPAELKDNDMIGRRFRTFEEADVFYRIYSAVLGFGVRKGALRLDVYGRPTNRTWLCCKEGHREPKYADMKNRVRTARGITREGCPALLRVNRCRRTNEWIVKAFVVQHSHQLATQPWVQYMRDKRQVTEGAMTTVRNMRSSGIRTSKIMSYMAQQVGGYDNVRFIVKDLYNNLNRENIDAIGEGDAERAIGYLQSKADMDANFYGKFAYDENNRLHSLFWADSQSRLDYARFGDVLSFDTTYKTNLYGKPLLVFVGVNNHYRSTIFGYAILINEVAETYIWALRSFMDCMNDVPPKAVITDGDLAMRAAIVDVMPNTTHRLCTWHIENNMVTHVKDPTFLPLMKTFMFKKFSSVEFEKRWFEVLVSKGLDGNNYLQQIYEKRHLWAETYLGNTFFAGMTTTQRCEKMNSLIKSKVTRHMTLVEFLRGIDCANSWLRHRQGEDEYKSFWTKPVPNVSNMPTIEEAAAAIYTPTMFYKVQAELKSEGKYVVTKLEETGVIVTAELTKYADKSKKKIVKYNAQEELYECECNLMLAKGYPCRHIFTCMKAMHGDHFPPALVVDRWRRTVDPRRMSITRSQDFSKLKFLRRELRFGHMNSKCSEMAALAAKSEEAFLLASNTIAALTGQLHSLFADKETDEHDVRNHEPVAPGLRNPSFTSTKGGWKGSIRGGKGKKRCSTCHRRGHNKATCSTQMAGKKRDRESEAEDEADVEYGDHLRTSFSYDPSVPMAARDDDVETSDVMERIGKGWWGNWY